MSADEAGWVTEPALETALALDAIQVGDQVKLRIRGAPEYGIATKLHGKVVRIGRDGSKEFEHQWDNTYYPVQTYGRHCYLIEPRGYWIRDVHIAAWKPRAR